MVPDVLKQSRRVESVLVTHIAEVDARRLYAREAASMMFRYCRDVLHLSVYVNHSPRFNSNSGREK